MKRMESSRRLSSSCLNVENRDRYHDRASCSGSEQGRNRTAARKSRLFVLVAALLAVFLPLLPVITVRAATAKPAVTDTQNLLGSQGAKIQESLDSLQKDTGVTINLLFVSSIPDSRSSIKQASASGQTRRLAFTKPSRNTLLLAVASQDGQMALAVSKGSDLWLSSQVDTTLSDAAAKPLARSNPDWSGSVTALIAQIRRVKSDHDSLPWRIAGGVALAALVIGVIVGIVLFLRWLRKIGFFTHHEGRHAAHGGSSRYGRKGHKGHQAHGKTRRKNHRSRRHKEAPDTTAADTTAPDTTVSS